MGRTRRPLTVAAASIALVAAGAIVAPAPASAHWSCGRAAPPDIDTSGGHHTVDAANMRVGSSTRCAESGVSYPSQSLDYHCYALDINGVDTWTYVVNVQTKVGGWIRDDLLNDYGSGKWCPNQTNL
ncbi:hypothetical protein [Micromonospora sp. 15K316]|uniref:hypothetical protein n=1 Tax=Micromonospora sp. 15K316 TaxID=2530376 RepID=UPI001FB71852|nr:hypothetical protein [Micromonospora sp. 15K316]